jgi:hypothetical protein
MGGIVLILSDLKIRGSQFSHTFPAVLDFDYIFSNLGEGIMKALNTSNFTNHLIVQCSE